MTLARLRLKLLAWFDRHRRDLPWRHSRDPYRIWVSEVMLQQTTVAAVIPYFHRFLARFPDVRTLAAADEQDVLTLWQGLGYYRRARHMHATARRIASEFDGTFPADPAVWTTFPGVGRYILGAVLSQAFDARLPIVEANSLRVLSRWFGSRLDPRVGEGKTWVWQAAAEVLPATRVGDFNQAMMELGATVCTPTNPRCGDCPVRAECVAHRDGSQGEIPPPARRKVVTAVREVTLVVSNGRKVLLGQLPPDAPRWANMWEAPRAEVAPHDTPHAAAERLAAALGVTLSPLAELGVIRHTVTRFAIELFAFQGTRLCGTPRHAGYAALAWVTPADWPAYPISTPQRKVLEMLDERRR